MGCNIFYRHKPAVGSETCKTKTMDATMKERFLFNSYISDSTGRLWTLLAQQFAVRLVGVTIVSTVASFSLTG